MARGQSQAADQQRVLSNQYGADAAARAARLRDTLVPGYQDLASGKGYSDVEKAGITSATMGGLGGTFDALRQSAANRVARTRNAAGFAEQEDELARSQGREGAQLAGGLTKGFADEAERRKEMGLAGLGNLYGIDQRELEAMLGLGPGTLGARAAGGGGFRFGFGPGGISFGGG